MTKIAFPPRAWQCLYSQGVSNSEDVFLASAGCEEAGEFSSLAPPRPFLSPPQLGLGAGGGGKLVPRTEAQQVIAFRTESKTRGK